jgi:hypothetical protein
LQQVMPAEVVFDDGGVDRHKIPIYCSRFTALVLLVLFWCAFICYARLAGAALSSFLSPTREFFTNHSLSLASLGSTPSRCA